MDFDYKITYQLFSELDNSKTNCFINKYKADIFVESPTDEDLKIGQLVFDIILINQIVRYNQPILHICETTPEIFEFANQFIEFDDNEFNEHFNQITNNSIMLNDFCLIKEFKLLPGFRGKSIGPIILKDLYFRFSNAVDFIVIKSMPFQLKKKRYNDKQHSDDEFLKAMTFDDLVFDEETAQLKLNAFFQKLGFKYVDKNYFLLDTRINQPKLVDF